MRTSLPNWPSGSVTHIPLQFTAAELLVHWLLDAQSGVFVSATLTPESQALLLERVPPVHPFVHAHHMTIAFDPPVERFTEVYQPMIGQEIRLRVVGVAQDEKGQAVRVEAQSENPNPHITVSCADGVPAKYSNELLSKGWNPVSHFELQATVQAVPLKPPEQPINPS